MVKIKFYSLAQILPWLLFASSCEKISQSKDNDKKPAIQKTLNESLIQNGDVKKTMSQWYLKQKAASDLVNQLATLKMEIDFKDKEPLELINMQRNAIRSITDLQVLSDERKNILVEWCKVQIEAANCLNQISGKANGKNLRILDFDSILEAQEESLREIHASGR